MSDSPADAPPPATPHEALSDLDWPVEILDASTVHDGAVWNVERERFAYNDHHIVREFIDHPGAVAVLAVDDQERILLIQQYRHPVRIREWELPAGLLDVEGEDPALAASRELAEEADLAASQWTELIDFHSSPGGSNEHIRVYEARGLRPAHEVFDRTEEEADIVLRWVPLEDAVRAVLDGRLRNSILIIAVLAAHARR